MSESFIIFICDFDYFGTGLAVNERVSHIKGTDCPYEDGSHVIFLNSHYAQANAGPAIMEYLDYIRTNDDSRDYTTELLHKTVEKVQEVCSDEKMEVSYMMWELKFQDAKAEGRAEGREETLLLNLKSLIKNTGWSLEQAMKALGVPQEKWPQYTKILTEQ